MSDQSPQERLAAAQHRIAELEASLEEASAVACEDRYRQVFDNAPGGMAIVTEEGEILLCNDEALRFLGLRDVPEADRNIKALYANVKDRERLLAMLGRERHIRNYEVPMQRPDGTPMWASLNVRHILYAGRKTYLVSYSDITEHREALRRLELDEIRFEKLYALSQMTQRPEAEILDFALAAITEVTGSPIGFIFRVSEDESQLSLFSWSGEVMEQCGLDAFPDKYRLEEAGLWGESLRRREPVIINDYQNHPDRRGCPEGHLPINRLLNLPVFDEQHMVLLAGIGNKEQNYTDEDIRQMMLIMNGTWRTIQRRRSRAELAEARTRLEEKVMERTASLEAVNRQLVEKDREREEARTELLRYERIIETNPDLISLIDREYRYVIINESCARMFDKRRSDVVGQTVDQLFGEDCFDIRLRPAIDRAFAGDTVREEAWIEFPTRGELYMSISHQPVRVQGDPETYVSFEARDITDLKRSEETLKAFAERLDLATNAADIGIWEWDLLTDALHWDHKMFNLYRIAPTDPDELYDLWRLQVHPDDLPSVEREVARTIEGQGLLNTEFRIIRPDGATRIIRAHAQVQVDDNNVPHRLIGLNQDITEQRNMEDELRTLASTDPLTGASNRRQFMSRLNEEFERCKRYNTSLVLLSLDIDHFKRINDTYGHPSGDDVLKELVILCQSTLRTTDLFGRVGGEEFQAALILTHIAAGNNTAERLRRRVEQTRVSTHGEDISFTISIGITALRPEDNSIEDILKRADDALYEAKRNGRNRVVQL
ncbi:diguanylate cyclase [Pseudodesulfovibrio indicus]|uniref:diguanylate cyclase n=1 Tax=Pseudodesulfovibrio indicus TaxID=1716143 RepID=UPI0029309BD8|nr:diguanylate cyclase [Pseudodesulfovibrio indicus]